MYLIIFLLLIKLAWGKPNFIFIIVDDLRPTLGCYDDVDSWSPNIDNLAHNGFLFTQAYAQQSLCAPSRNSLLTSRRPDTLKLYDFYSYWRNTVGNFTTLPQHLKNNGYITKSIGKIFHPGISSNYSDDSPYSWSDTPFHPLTNRFKDSPVCPSTTGNSSAKNLICPVSLSSMPMKTLPDIENLNAANDFLINYKNKFISKPFFLAVGFEKPHIPFKYPKKYLEYHPIEKFKLNNYYWPNNISNVAYNPWTDIRERKDVEELNLIFPWQKIPHYFGKKIIQSYYAAVSYVDDIVGQLLKKIHKLNLDNNTVIVLTSDHGWSLGQHSQWGKYSNFDVALRVPLIISLPKYQNKLTNNNINKNINSIVELVDIFPTIAELAECPIKICPVKNKNDKLCSEGISFVPLINANLKNQTIKWKQAAFSQYPRPGMEPTWHPNSDKPKFDEIKIMGYTLRTKHYRYTAWIKFKYNKIYWNKILAEELYDHRVDPNEMSNLSNNPIYKNLKLKLNKQLKIGWHGVLPN